MNSSESMRRDWDDRARKDAFFYIASWRQDWDEDAFFQSGGEDYKRLVANVLSERQFSPVGKSMLELGCGAGRMTRSFACRFQSVLALDISSEMLSRAKALQPHAENIEWVLANGADLAAVPSNSVDFVFSYLVLQHLPKAELVQKYISEMLRVLAAGGLCLFQFNGTVETNMNWKGKAAWKLMDLLWTLHLRGMAKGVARVFGFDPAMAGKNWHGVALKAQRIVEIVRASGGASITTFGENTPMAWCCASKIAGAGGESKA
jgi:ubiquinone/menaquinone biosynthesis C-methylase UbiE